MFYPLNYGNKGSFDFRFAIADCKQRRPYACRRVGGFVSRNVETVRLKFANQRNALSATRCLNLASSP